MNQDLNQLLIDLINIPSWVDYSQNPVTQHETKLVDYIADWVKTNAPSVEVEKQPLAGGRFNLILKKGDPEIIFLGHTDTVAPSINAEIDQTRGTLKDGKIYGRGSTDMKSGVAAILYAIKSNPNANNFWAMFYADEEYFFLGMKEIVKKYGHLRPKYLVSADGSDLKIGYGCRGLIELRLRVKGQTGHAAKGNGLNAIVGSFNAYQNLRSYLDNFNHPEMGNTTSNLAWILGGAELQPQDSYQENRLVKVRQAGNVIPDIAELIIDIRPATPDLTISKIIDNLESYLDLQGYKMEIVESTHNLGAWYTEPKELAGFIKITEDITNSKVELQDPKKTGYLDLQMIWETLGRPVSVMFGGGDGKTAHSSQEYISTENLAKTARFFESVIRREGV